MAAENLTCTEAFPLTTHYWSTGPADLILCQNHLALFAIRPENLPRSEWQPIAGEIKAWCTPQFRIVETKSNGDAIPSL
jgi:hypothetical protein